MKDDVVSFVRKIGTLYSFCHFGHFAESSIPLVIMTVGGLREISSLTRSNLSFSSLSCKYVVSRCVR